MSGYRPRRAQTSPVEIAVGTYNGMIYVYTPYLRGVPEKMKSLGAKYSRDAQPYNPNGELDSNLPPRPAWILHPATAMAEKKALETISGFPMEQLETALSSLSKGQPLDIITPSKHTPVRKMALPGRISSLDDIATDSEDESDHKRKSDNKTVRPNVSIQDLTRSSAGEERHAIVSTLGSKLTIKIKPSAPVECYDTEFGPLLKVNGIWRLLTYGSSPHTVNLS